MSHQSEWLFAEAGFVTCGVIDEIGMLPIDEQDPGLVAQALACARIMDDPDNALVWPQVCGRMAALLAALHEGESDD